MTPVTTCRHAGCTAPKLKGSGWCYKHLQEERERTAQTRAEREHAEIEEAVRARRAKRRRLRDLLLELNNPGRMDRHSIADEIVDLLMPEC